MSNQDSKGLMLSNFNSLRGFIIKTSTTSSNNMKKGIILLTVGLVLGSVGGYFYHAYKYKTQLEEARNFEAKQVLDNIVYGNVTDKVQISCHLGNRKSISAKDATLKFAGNDFDENGNFINRDKDAAIQKVCEITKDEVNAGLDKVMKGGTAEKLFEVTLSK